MRIEGIRGALAGRILRVDLTSRRVWTENTEDYARRWLGGRAIASWILLSETPPGTRWSDPDCPLIFSPGCLVGTYSPGASRTSVDSINTFNNGKGSANFGGHWGAELKYAGYDHLVIKGKSDLPVYLWIQDDKVEIRDAAFLWGRFTDETEALLQDELGDERVSVTSIGPAGENLVRGSGILGDCGNAAAGCGVGCVMGSKKLKAIAVRGHGAIKVAEPARFMKAVASAREKIESSPFIKGNERCDSFRRGLIVAYRQGREPGLGPVRNGQDEYFPVERTAKLVGVEQGVPSFYKRMWSCFDCPIGCQPFLEITEGKYKGTSGFAYWGNSKAYSARMDSDDPGTSARFHQMCNQLGMDADTASVVSSWAFECYEKGLLTRQDTDGLELVWGNDDAWLALVEKIGRRDGIGDLLADGVVRASARLGKGSEEFIAHCKGQDTIETFRYMPGWSLGIATSPVGGHHLRGAVIDPASSGPSVKDVPRTFDKPDNQPEAVYWQLRTKEMEDATGTCVFMGSLSGAHALLPEDYLELMNAALGTELSPEDFMRLGEAGYNLEKAFNSLNTDFDRKDDYPPKRFMKEVIKSGPFAGRKVDKEEFDRMLDRFYELLGWDRESGLQTAGRLAALGMQDVAGKLAEIGKLK